MQIASLWLRQLDLSHSGDSAILIASAHTNIDVCAADDTGYSATLTRSLSEAAVAWAMALVGGIW
jgi:hypothetical protein